MRLSDGQREPRSCPWDRGGRISEGPVAFLSGVLGLGKSMALRYEGGYSLTRSKWVAPISLRSIRPTRKFVANEAADPDG